MDTSPYNIEDKPSHVSLPTWEQFKASIRAAPNFNSADEIQKMHGASDAARTVAHALLAKSVAGYHALTGGDADADSALLGPKSISPEGQYMLHGAMDTVGNLGKATGVTDLAHSLSSKYNAVQGAVEPLVQKYLGVPAAAAAHAAFEAAPQAAIPGLGEEKALAGATGDALEQLAAHHIQNGGSTFHPGTGTMPSSGYAVSLHPGRAQVLSTAPTGEDLGKYLQANKDAFTKDPAAHMGTWHDVNDSGNHYLDVSHVDPDLGSAMEKAKGANQKAIFDLGSFNEIPNPHYNAALDTQAGPVAVDSPLAAESPLEFKATDPGRVHLNSSPAALEREGEAARRDAADAPPPEAAPDLGPMPPHNDSYVGNQAFAKGGIVADALQMASKLPVDDGMMHFLHMSNLKDPEVTLDAKLYGSGMKGAEARRGGTKTISVYPADIDPAHIEQPLQGKTPYRVSLPEGSMYDMSADPSGFRESEPSFSDAEDAVKAAGYAGYHVPEGQGILRGQGRLFGTAPATRLGPVEDRLGPVADDEDLSSGFAEGGEVGLLGDALKTASRLPTPTALAAKYADNPAAIENFHDWAKQTKVTDPSGAPMPLYHNTDAFNDFSAFRPYRGDIGSHFGTQGQANMRGASTEGRVPPAVEANTRDIPVAKNQQSGQRTIPAYLSIQNPLRTPDLGEWGHEQLQRYLLDEAGAFDPNHKPGSGGSWRQPAVIAGIDPNAVQATQNNHQLRKVLQDAGYDGIVYQNNGEPNIPPAIQLARQDAMQKRDAFVQQNKPYMQAAVKGDDIATQFPEQHAQFQELHDQYQLADEAYRRFYHDPNTQADSYVAFDPSQVKSAVGNTGEFDPTTQDINHAAGGNVRGYADGGSAELGTIGDAIQQVSHLPLEATAAEAAPLAEHVAQYGGATYSPASGALHRSGTVTADPESTVALDHAPDPDEIHDFMMHNQHALGDDPSAVLHITSDDKGNHFMRTGTHEPEMPPDPNQMEPSELIDKYLQSGLSSKHPMASESDYSARPGTPWTAGQQTVANPQRNAFPGVYGDPRQVISDAAAKVGPEDPLMQRLFGVSRADLSDLALSRQGNELGVLPGEKTNPQGAAAARDVMTPQNEQRLIDVLSEARKDPGLYQGMTGWYAMDPLFQRFVKEFGPEEAVARYKQFNTLSGMASPGSDVGTEIARGSSANWLHNQGRFADFARYGGGMESGPADMADIPGHVYHRTAQALPMQQYLDSGEMQMKSPKVPMYIAASGVPETGFQTSTPVGDAHWARGVGLADTRGNRTLKGRQVVPGSSVSTPEMQTLAPWFRDRVAAPSGLEAVPAQALMWGAFSPQTGVKSAIGAPKLEILSTQIGKLATRLGISPEHARDLVVAGKAGAFSGGGQVGGGT